MSIEKRRFIRFSLDIPAYQFNKDDEPAEIMVRQISIGGCLTELDESVLIGDELRLEFTLPNKNRLPVYGKAIYQFNGNEFGMKFSDITQFEQELLASVISDNLEAEGLPLLVDPFTVPNRVEREQEVADKKISKKLAKKIKDDDRVDEIIASEV